MGFRDKKYGVTWKTTLENIPTTVWFNSSAKRISFIEELKRNKIVIKRSICTRNKNVDEDEL